MSVPGSAAHANAQQQQEREKEEKKLIPVSSVLNCLNYQCACFTDRWFYRSNSKVNIGVDS